MRSNLVTAAGEGWLSRFQGWLGQDPPDNKRRRGQDPPDNNLSTWAQKSAPRKPPDAMQDTAPVRGVQTTPPHVKTNGRQEYVARTTPHSSG